MKKLVFSYLNFIFDGCTIENKLAMQKGNYFIYRYITLKSGLPSFTTIPGYGYLTMSGDLIDDVYNFFCQDEIILHQYVIDWYDNHLAIYKSFNKPDLVNKV